MKNQLLITLFFVLTSSCLYAQSSSDLIKDKLVKTGFENVRIRSEGDVYTISFENNIYRWNVRALSSALDIASKYAAKGASLNIIQLVYDIPQITASVNASEWLKFRNDTLVNGSMDSALSISYRSKDNWELIKKLKPLNRNTVKFDFIFYPQFYVTNLTFNSIYEVQFNIAPAIEVSFWRGMLLTAQVIIPIYSHKQVYGFEGNKVRPGFIVLSQNFRLNGPWFGNVSIGNFNNNRYGLDLSIRHPFINARWDIGFNSGLTGYFVVTNNSWEIGLPNTLTFSLSAGYFLPRFNLRFNVKAGRFLQGDYGGRFDLTRMFGETSIGFYAAYSVMKLDEDGFPNFGFHFTIPFRPGKGFKRKKARVNLPRYFDWEYNGATDFLYNRYYERRPNENKSEHYFNPFYIKNELMKNRHYK